MNLLACPPPQTHTHTHMQTFLGSKKKKGETKGKKSFKAELLKTCQQGQNVTLLAILECLEFKDFSC